MQNPLAPAPGESAHDALAVHARVGAIVALLTTFLLLLGPDVGRAATTSPAPAWVATVQLVAGDRPFTVALYENAAEKRGFVTVERAERRWTSPVYSLWKARAADLDGDGAAEVLLGIWSHRRRHREPQPHRTVWVLRWDGRQLVESWRGSALARPLVDFETAELDGRAPRELLALERTPAGCHLTAYRWNGFGFSGVARRERSCEGLRLCEPETGDDGRGCVRDPRGRWGVQLAGRRLRLGPYSAKVE